MTLTTDFGLSDPFVGMMKGVIANINPSVNIIDITHEIESHQIFEGAFVLFQSYKFFPSGTIHIAVVDPGVGGNRNKLIIKTNNYTFVVPDNGIASFIIDKEDVEIFEIYNRKYFLPEVSNTFHGRDIFAPVGAFLSKGIKPESIGEKTDKFNTISMPRVEIDKKRGIATVIYIDKFGNLITNIKNDLLDNIKAIYVNKGIINRVSIAYEDGSPGELLTIPGSLNFVEISMNQDNTAKKMKVKSGDRIYFDLK